MSYAGRGFGSISTWRGLLSHFSVRCRSTGLLGSRGADKRYTFAMPENDGGVGCWLGLLNPNLSGVFYPYLVVVHGEHQHVACGHDEIAGTVQ